MTRQHAKQIAIPIVRQWREWSYERFSDNLGMKTLAGFCRDAGYDWREVARQRAEMIRNLMLDGEVTVRRTADGLLRL